jgi:hypothetical protein
MSPQPLTEGPPPSPILQHITVISLIFLLQCRQMAQMDAVDAEAVTVFPQVVVTAAVVVGVGVPLPSIELLSLEESATIIGLLELVAVDLTVVSSTKQGPSLQHLLSPHPSRLQIILPTSSPSPY